MVNTGNREIDSNDFSRHVIDSENLSLGEFRINPKSSVILKYNASRGPHTIILSSECDSAEFSFICS
jgi:hypothetical protein